MLAWRFLAIAALLLGYGSRLAAEENKPATPLLGRQPFDRITLDSANNGAVLDVEILDLPARKVPEVFPTSGQLEVTRLSEPSVLYNVSWTSIEKIELFEQLLLSDAKKQIAAKDFDKAFKTLDFLKTNYPTLPGLQPTIEQYLIRDAAASYKAKRYDEAISILMAVYDANPQRPGLEKIVQAVGDRLINEHLSTQNFSSARSVLDLYIQGFPNLEIASASSWQQKFKSDANQQIIAGRKAFEQRQYQAARLAVRRAQGILPQVSGARELLREIEQVAPQIVVGVNQHGMIISQSTLGDWSSTRVERILAPQFVELTDFGAEGGIYDCPWANLSSDDSGLEMKVGLTNSAIKRGLTPERIVNVLMHRTNPSNAAYQPSLGKALGNIRIYEGQEVQLHWLLSHVRPESLLRFRIGDLFTNEKAPNTYQASTDDDHPEIVRYKYSTQNNRTQGSAPTVIERTFIDDEEAVSALLRGDVHVLDRIPPWQIAPLREAKEIVIDTYRLPTVHVLIPNHSKSILGRREFRRALCYGIDRQRLLVDILLAGYPQPGFQVLSGPLPSGSQHNDPVGYAYDPTIMPRPYEPRLAAVLSKVARTSLAKIQALQDGMKPGELDKVKPAPAEPLLLVHPANSLARTACQTIKLQLDAIGIPIQLQELEQHPSTLPVEYDLLYSELTLWEPLVDAVRLLGPQGRAGSCTAAMSLALQNVDRAQNWKQARLSLRQVHRVAASDLPVIPLWQTINSFAYRRSLTGVGTMPVSLYQNISDWKNTVVAARQ